MRPPITSPWGKLEKDEVGQVVAWLPLAMHCIDVACVFRALVGLPWAQRALQSATPTALEERHYDRLAVLAFLHDVGKCNLGFQAKSEVAPAATAGHVRELALMFDADWQPRWLEGLRYPVMQKWFVGDETALRMLIASVSHHGAPVVFDGVTARSLARFWAVTGTSRDPLQDVADLVSAATGTFPAAFAAGGLPIQADGAFQQRFAGLVMLADWVGSHRESFFPFEAGVSDRVAFARNQADHALRAIGLDAGPTRGALPTLPLSFEACFGFAPTPLQQALADDDERVTIVESETGSGKTEAALARFLALYRRNAVDALYFALPTRVAAREIYERVRTFVDRAFPLAPPVVLAVPGYARVDGQPADCLPDPSNRWHDEDIVGRRERAWSSENSKRFLAAPIAVGTIDQALLATVQRNHAHLRAVCLERSLIVVDEAHASDVYMRGLLRALLAHHSQAGGYALLLSATLGSEARGQFLHPDSAPPSMAYEAAREAPYPSIAGAQSIVGVARTGPTKRVSLEPRPAFDRLADALDDVSTALAEGARILVVVNTVARAIELQGLAEGDESIRPHLFQSRGVRCLHHGRYARVDRLHLDASVTDYLGKAASKGPRLLIGTQTLEQSLDIDADWLITDLCPMDVLLQRIGRLHRHDRARPHAFRTARCTVLVPESSTLASFFDDRGRVRSRGGLGGVYPDLRMLRLTRQAIGDGTMISIPEDNRALVEATTHSERLATITDRPWIQHGNEMSGYAMAHGQAARRAAIPWRTPFGIVPSDLRFHEFDERVATRLGLNDRRVALEPALEGPFGTRIDELNLPGFLAPSDCPDSVPASRDGEMIRLACGERVFRYSRFGLERIETP